MASNEGFSPEEAIGLAPPVGFSPEDAIVPAAVPSENGFSPEEAVGPVNLVPTGVPGIKPAGRAKAAKPQAPRVPAPVLERPQVSFPDDRQREAQDDYRRLIGLEPPTDPRTGLSMRQATPEAARYREALDGVLRKYGGQEGFKTALAGSAPGAQAPQAQMGFSPEEAIRSLTNAERLNLNLDPIQEPVPLGEKVTRAARRGVLSLGNALRGVGVLRDLSRLQTDMGSVKYFVESRRLTEEAFADRPDVPQDVKDAQLAAIDERIEQLQRNIGITAEEMRGRLLATLRAQAKQGKIPASDVTTRAIQAKTFSEFFDVVAEDPFTFILEIGIESLPIMLPSIFLSVAGGAVAGPVGFAAGLGVGSGMVEVGLTILDQLAKFGADLNDPESVRRVFEEHADEIKRFAYTRGLAIGAFDAASGGIILKRFVPRAAAGSSFVSKFARTLGETAIQTPIQGVLGGAGEATAQIATEGRITEPGQVGAEFAGELAQAPIEVAVGTAVTRRGPPPPPGPPPPTEEVPEGPTSGFDLNTEGLPFNLPDPPAPPPEAREPTPDEQRRGDLAQSLDEVLRAEEPAAIEALPPSVPRETTTDAEVTAAAAQTDPDPTEAQKKAGNYQKGHVRIQGLDITIETPRGGTRSGVGPDGVPWTVTLPAHYGYVKGTEGADGDQVDVYIGPSPQSQTVWIVDQLDLSTGRFDEHKAMLGFTSVEEAQAAYVAGFSDNQGLDRLGDITPLPIEDFGVWVNQGVKAEPVGDLEQAQNALRQRRALIESAGEPQVTTLGAATTGQPFSQRLYRGFGREVRDDPEVFSMPDTGPVLGPGLYYSTNPAEATRFGPQIDDRIVTLQNPLVIDSDAQWRTLTKQAGWEFPNLFRLDPADFPKVREEITALRSLIENQGHDGVVIRLTPVVQGDRTKTLRGVFGEDQVAVFGQAAVPVSSALTGDIFAPSDSDGGGSATPPARASGSGLPSVVEVVDPDTIEFDAKNFQFKSGADERGVTERLAGVETFEPFLADQITIYEYLDGRRVVADGHQRLALAQRAKAQGQQFELQTFVLRESDGIAPGEARVIAAAKNIAQENPTAIDAATIIREVGIENMPPLPPTGRIVRDGKALANLADVPFGMVKTGVATEAQGAAVGQAVNDQAQQLAVLDLLIKTRQANRAEIDALVQEAISIGFKEGTQETLFGAEQIAETLIVERAQIKTVAMARLRRDRATFNSLLQRSGVISDAGNVLNETANQRRVRQDDEFLQTINTLATRTGPVSEALTGAARELKGGRSLQDVTGDFIDAIKAALAQTGPDRLSVGPPGRRPGEPDRRPDQAAQARDREAPGAVAAEAIPDLTPMDVVHLAAIDRAIEEGGGWANFIRGIPGGGGRHNVERFIDLGIFEEEDGFVRRTADPKKAIAELTRRRIQQRAQDDAADAALASERKAATRGEPTETTTEQTEQGEQAVIPGAERITDRELLERRGKQPLRSKKAQKETDFGLFGEDPNNQGELFSRGNRRPIRPRQAAMRTAYQLAQGARDFMPMKRILEQAGLRLRVIDANRLGITLDETSGRRVPALRILTRVARINGVTLIIENPPTDPKLLRIYDNLAFRRNDEGEVFYEPGAGDVRYSAGLIGFYSKLERTIESKMPERALPEQVRATIQNAAIKQEEIDWSDIMRWLDGWPSRLPIEKVLVLEFIRANQVRIIEQPPRVSTVIADLTFDEEQRLEPTNEFLDESARDVYFDDALADLIDESSEFSDLRPFTSDLTKADDQDLVDDARERALIVARERAETGYFDNPVMVVRETTYGYEIHWDRDSVTGQTVLDPDGTVISTSTMTMGGARTIIAEHARQEFGQAAEGEFAWGDPRYNLPGGTDYSEALLIWANPPEGTTYTNEVHWENDKNFIAHVRTDVRQDTQGRKILFLEEVQSDWHQQGRERGYSPTTRIEQDRAIVELDDARNALAEARSQTLDAVRGSSADPTLENDLRDEITKHSQDQLRPGAILDSTLENWIDEFLDPTFPPDRRKSEMDIRARLAIVVPVDLQIAINDGSKKVRALAGNDRTRVPSAPFKRVWHELVMKRMLRQAVDMGMDGLAWTSGEQQNERYDLGQLVDQIQVTYIGSGVGSQARDLRDEPFQSDGPYTVRALAHDSVIRTFHAAHRGDLERFLGRGLTEQILQRGFTDGGFQREGTIILRPEDFHLGDEGMKGFYGSVDPETGAYQAGMLGRFMGRYGKKWGAKAETTEIELETDIRFTVRPLQFTPEGADSSVDAWRVYDTELGEYVADTTSTVQGKVVLEARKLNIPRLVMVPFIAITERMKQGVAEGQPLFAAQPRPADTTVDQRRQALGMEVVLIAQQMAPQANLKLVRRMFSEGGVNRAVERSGGVPGQEVSGAYAAWEDLITVSLGFDEPKTTIRHETIHHLRETGLLNEREWSTLAGQAEAWRQEFGLPPGEGVEDADMIAEEAVAYAFQEHHSGAAVRVGAVAHIFNKIAVFFRRLWNALKLNGFQTFEDVFGRIESGVVGRRPQTFRPPGRDRRLSAGTPRPRFNDNFWAWFGTSKVLTPDGAPRRLFRGDNRLDLFGPVFRKKLATVAGFYFTTDSEVASNYAKNKPDVNVREAFSQFEDWFTFPAPKGQRRRLNLRFLWYHLDAAQQARVKEVLLKTGLTDDGAFDFTGANELTGRDNWDWWAQEHRGNWLMAGVEGWLSSAMIFSEEERFGEILKEMGLDQYEFDSPNLERPGVMPVYLSIQNPVDTSNVTQNFFLELEHRVDPGSLRQGAVRLEIEVFFDQATRFIAQELAKLPEGSRGPDAVISTDGEMLWTGIPPKVRDALQRMGHDGIRDRGGKTGGIEHDVWIAFEPWQIKSIFNRGTWDPTKRDIRYSARWNRPGRKGNPLFGYSFTLPSPNVLDHLRNRNRKLVERLSGAFQVASDPARIKLQDRFLVLKRIEEQIALQRGLRQLPDNIDAYMAEELFHGRTGQLLAEFQQQHVEPLVETMEELGITLEELEQYLYARHAQERNRQIASINPEMPDGGSGMTNAEAQEILDRIQQGNRLSGVASVAARVDAINQARLNLLEGEGLISPQDRLAWSQTYQHYVPLRGLDDDEFPDLPSQGRGFDIRGLESRRALGRESQAKDILAYVLAQMEETIVRAEKNRVGRTFLRLVQANPNPDVWAIDQVEYTRRINPKTGLVEAIPDPAYQVADNVLAVKVGGQVHHITIYNRSLARAMKNLGAESVGIITQGLLTVNRYLAMINTSLNPEFPFSNFPRDIQAAVINLQGFDIENAARNTVRDVGKAMRGVWHGQRGDFDSEWGQYFKEFANAGGTVGFYSLLDIPSRVKRINRLISNLKPGRGADVRRITSSAFTFIQDVNMAIENATRLSAYVQARRAGMSVERSASLAKNLTVNFNRKGEWGVVGNALYLFYNAQVQGTIRLLQALRSPKVRKLVLGIIGGFAALEIMNQMLARAIQGDDGENDWDKVSKWTKEHNMMLVNPMRLIDPDSDLLAFKIPMSYGYNVFAVMGQKIGEMVMGKNDPLNAAIELALASVNAFNPLGGEDSFLQLVSPTIIDPAVEIAINRDFAGRPISPTQPSFGPRVPDSQLYWNSTEGTLTQWVTEQLNELTGGSEFRSGAIDVSPETLDHLFAFFTGGVGTFMQRNVDFTIKLINGEPIPVRRIPFVRRLLEGTNEFWVQNKYFELRDAVAITQHEIKILRKTRRSDEATASRIENRPDVKIAPRIKAANRRLKNLRRQRDRARTNEVMLPEARREKIREINRTMNAVMQGVVDRHRALTKQQQELD